MSDPKVTKNPKRMKVAKTQEMETKPLSKALEENFSDELTQIPEMPKQQPVKNDVEKKSGIWKYVLGGSFFLGIVYLVTKRSTPKITKIPIPTPQAQPQLPQLPQANSNKKNRKF